MKKSLDGYIHIIIECPFCGFSHKYDPGCLGVEKCGKCGAKFKYLISPDYIGYAEKGSG